MAGIENIKWLGHAAFKIKNSKVIYIDPWNLKTAEAADIILVTHDHYDHCSVEDISSIQKEGCVIVGPQACMQKLSANTKAIKPGESLTVQGIDIEAYPAYNIGKAFHPKSSGVGFVITLEGIRIYHAGDTDLIPEMDNIKADFALLPIGGTYTMDAQQAADCANKIKPRVAIPMHYGSIVGDARDAERFKKLCNAEVRILEEGK